MTDISDKLYDIAKQWIQNNDSLNTATLIPFATHLMAAVQKLSGPNSGLAKKEAVMNVTKRIINDTVEEGSKETLLKLSESLLGPAIDAIIALSSSGALRKWWKQVKKACCPCLR